MANLNTMADELLDLCGADVSKCMKCGRCSASCPVSRQMDLHPHEFVSKMRNRDVDCLFGADAAWKCLSCFCCMERCPRDVKPAMVLEAVRQAILRKKGDTGLNPDEIPGFVTDDMPQQLLVSAFRKHSK